MENKMAIVLEYICARAWDQRSYLHEEAAAVSRTFPNSKALTQIDSGIWFVIL